MVYAHNVNTKEELLQRILSAARASKCYKFCGHTSQKMHPSRRRILRTICLSVERRIRNCTFNSIAQ